MSITIKIEAEGPGQLQAYLRVLAEGAFPAGPIVLAESAAKEYLRSCKQSPSAGIEPVARDPYDNEVRLADAAEARMRAEGRDTIYEPQGAAEDITAAMAAGRVPIPEVERVEVEVEVEAKAGAKRKRRTKAEMAADAATERDAIPADVKGSLVDIEEAGTGEAGESFEDQAAEASTNAAVSEADAQKAKDEALMMLRAYHLSGRGDAAEVIDKLRAEFGVTKFFDVPAERGPELLVRAHAITAGT